jgi:hypothetical protein
VTFLLIDMRQYKKVLKDSNNKIATRVCKTAVKIGSLKTTFIIPKNNCKDKKPQII